MNLKLIAAALAFAAAGSAQAEINLSSTGNGELFLNVWTDMGTADVADDRSYTRDLGMFVNSFISNVAVPVVQSPFATTGFTLLADANWASFSTGAAGTINWSVIGSDNSGLSRSLSTVQSAPATQIKNNVLVGWNNAANIFVSQVNGQMDASNTVSVNDSASTVGGGNAYYAGKLASDWGAGGYDMVATLGEQMDFGWFGQNGTGTSGTSNKAIFSGQFLNTAANDNMYFKLESNGTLVYAATAPVPEADSYALMLAGMGLVGFLARRRKA